MDKKTQEQIIKENLETYKRFKIQIDTDEWGWYGAVSHFQCINCGKYCSRGNFEFFNKDPEKVLCFKCQGKEE